VRRSELEAARRDLEILVGHARRKGWRGRVEIGEHLLEILLGRSPALLERLHAKILEPLGREENTELARTLRMFVACRYDRTATSSTLHIHRNTLAYRLRRIEQATGLDLASPRDLAAVYAAMQADAASG
jgi:sugar diacid utilization regulator